ncbi:hypothetical protein Q4603_08940 [Zobellia galactanivorans]|uniref:toxin-antitoxin system YwqK family antitoxin n=1 Tax=Zobellia galactanivorans (strain DSM 12802 / CCUG 47099 / CIP 106680 / NCIMB 13871 / Dsij) TaxID=63186 RepID=UPI0026E2664D|nr:hypothetical protein [Zobellia galactanivorans]MDO6808735.1 hypothetical protein [Zobellia galactanivorans]
MNTKYYTLCLLVFTLFFQTEINAQNDTIYYDHNWGETTKSNASFYRPLPLKQDGNKYLVKDYYIDGTLQFEGWELRMDATEATPLGANTYYDGTVVWYYPNGHKKTTITYKNKKENGAITSYYENGAVKSDAEVLDGEWQSSKSYDKEGKLLTTLHYKDGRANEGISKCFIQYKEGRIIAEQLYYENTKILAYERICPDKGCYDENTEIFYDKSGRVIQKNNCMDEKVLDGAAISFFKGNRCGYVKGIKSITKIEHGGFNGPYTRYDNNGDVIYSGIYKDNEPYEGTFETEDEDNLTYITTYTKGTKNGKETVWNKGKKIAEGFYKEGLKQDGTFVEKRQFTGWSKIPIIVNLKDGKEEGQQKFYNVARDMTIGYYHAKAGIKEGAYAAFYYDGEVLAEATYKDGKPFEGIVLINDEYRAYKNGVRIRENVVVDSEEQERLQAFSKGSDTVEGGYNMGGFEMASSIVFLDTHQFFFSLSVGSMDLVMYGAYHLKNGSLKLQVPKEQKQAFAVYGRKDDTLKDTVRIQYYNYDSPSKPLLQLNKQWYALDDDPQEAMQNYSHSYETFQVDVKKPTSLKLGIKTKDGQSKILHSILEAETLQAYNDFIIAYNVTSDEIRKFENAEFTFKGENLIVDGKEKKKRLLSPEDKEDVLDYIIENRGFPAAIKNNTYKKIKLKDKTVDKTIKKYTNLIKIEE